MPESLYPVQSESAAAPTGRTPRFAESGAGSAKGPAPSTLYSLVGKPLLDRSTAVLGLVVLSPVLLALALAIRTRLGAPILFRQQRPGKDGVPFEMVKFRTMTNEKGPDGELLTDEERLTPFGQFLRSSSLDELPELWNVLKGDMSLVGPRPLLMHYLELYSPEQARRHAVPPGITGLAQVSGRNAISWDEKFAFDVWYVDHCSLTLDIQILWRTLTKVLKRDGVAQEGQATVQYFTGNQE